MHRPLDRLIGRAIIAGVILIVYLLLEVLDRVTASPAMRAHVNEGSAKFFRERGNVWQAAFRALGDRFGSFGSRWF